MTRKPSKASARRATAGRSAPEPAFLSEPGLEPGDTDPMTDEAAVDAVSMDGPDTVAVAVSGSEIEAEAEQILADTDANQPASDDPDAATLLQPDASPDPLAGTAEEPGPDATAANAVPDTADSLPLLPPPRSAFASKSIRMSKAALWRGASI